MTLTQKDTVLRVLSDSGAGGVRSDQFLAMGIPRAAARVLELRNEGYEISSTREKQFTRYTLVGLDAGGGALRKDALRSAPEVETSVESDDSVPAAPSEPNESRLGAGSGGALFELPKPPSNYDPYGEAA